MDSLMSAYCLLSLTWPQKPLETFLRLLKRISFGSFAFGIVGLSFGRAH